MVLSQLRHEVELHHLFSSKVMEFHFIAKCTPFQPSSLPQGEKLGLVAQKSSCFFVKSETPKKKVREEMMEPNRSTNLPQKVSANERF